MSNDRELLEWAAKAAGNSAQWDCDDRGMIIMSDNGCDVDTWNPLEDDGDCARLESECSIDVFWCPNSVLSMRARDIVTEEQFASHDGDRNAARRLASTRAAAEIGKAMV